MRQIIFALCIAPLLFFSGGFTLAATNTSRSSEEGVTRLKALTKFPLIIEKGKGYFVDESRQPFLVLGDTAWSILVELNREDVEVYLGDRQMRGFNTIVVNLLEHKFSRNPPRNVYGDAPFLVEGDFGKPNEDYFRHVDWVLQKAADSGFLVLLAPAYLGFKGGEEGWYSEMKRNGPEKLRKYGEFLGKRYAGFANIVWVEGGDFNPPDRTLVNAIAEGIRLYDKKSLQTAHCAPETMASEFWGNGSWLSNFRAESSWLDFNTLYTSKPVHVQARKAWEIGARPYILIESTYEFEYSADEHRVREQAYQALLSGAAGHVYGNNPVWHFNGPGIFEAPMNWKEALGSRGSESMAHVAKLFKQVEWWKLEPDVDGKVLVGGIGPDADRAVAAIDKDRKLVIIYVPSYRILDLDLSGLQGSSIEARWYDPSTGEYIAVDYMTSSSRAKFEMPKQDRSGRSDLVLVLRAFDSH